MVWIILVLGLGHFVSAEVSVISPGGIHSIALNDKAELFVWGANHFGQLGVGDVKSRRTPERLVLSKKVRAVFTRRDHACILFEDSSVKCMGSNHSGELGLGSVELFIGGAQNLEQLPSVNLGQIKPKKMFLGNGHTCILGEKDELKCFGSNLYGELGVGSAVKNIGTKPSEMGNALTAVNLGRETPIDGCAGQLYSCVLLQSGAVKCFGNFQSIGSGGTQSLGSAPGQLGENLKPVNLGASFPVKKLACADSAVCALSMGGDVKCWGKNTGGVLGGGILEDTVIGDAAVEMGESLLKATLEPGLATKDIACGSAHCCAILENCAVKCWGNNKSGQLGLGDTKNRGLNLSEMGVALPFIDLGDKYCATKLSMGSISSCATLKTGSTKCWGGNQSAQLGTGESIQAVGVSPDQMGNALKDIQLPHSSIGEDQGDDQGNDQKERPW